LHVSIDIEAAGPAPAGRLIQIGAVAFDLTFGASEQVEMLVDTAKCLDVVIAPYELGVDGRREIEFWQSPGAAEAKRMINAAPAVELAEGLSRLSEFVQKYLGNGGSVWAKPPSFDCTILRHAYRLAGLQCPWSFRVEDCVRTAVRMAKRIGRGPLMVPDDQRKGLVKHYAVHDAIEQALLVRAAWRSIAGRRPAIPVAPV
jgi:hypothetical protein